MRLIDIEDLLTEYNDPKYQNCWIAVETAKEHLEEIEPIDIVHCWDCIYFRTHVNDHEDYHCVHNGLDVGKDDFCSQGERTADEN